MAPLEIVENFVPLDRHLDVDRDHPLARTRVAVDVIHRFPRPVRQFGNPLPDRAFDIVLNLAHPLQHLLATVLGHQPLHLALGDLRGLRL